MSSFPPTTTVFNDGYIAETYEAYRRDPSSVDESWRQFFRTAESLAGVTGGAAGAGDPALLRKTAGAAALIDAIRHYGHLAVQLDPLGSKPPGAAELTPEFHGITEQELADVPASALGYQSGTAADVVRALRGVYCNRIGLEFVHLGNEEERLWFRRTMEEGSLTQPLSADEKLAVLRRLTEVDGLERFLQRAYVGYKRFSIEGTDVLVPMIDEVIARGAQSGARRVVMGMAHRGRLNVLTHVMGMSYVEMFGEFEGRQGETSADSSTGDVKYHLGYENERKVGDVTVKLELAPNPSHLEVVNPVMSGMARANQRVAGAPNGRDERLVLPICIHGDAAFPGEGVVPETFNLSRLRAYRVGGTLHIIVNNQVGFTTDPVDARSTHYASDLAKGFEVPIVHVNAEDASTCIRVIQLGIEYRAKFGKDFLVDLVGYRRHGHNETDEPAFTQPAMYTQIRSHPSPREMWGKRLTDEGVITADEVGAVDADVAAMLEKIQSGASASDGETQTPGETVQPKDSQESSNENPRGERLVGLNEQLLGWPQNIKPNSRLAKTLRRRREAVGDAGGIDWGHAEALAFASLLADGTSVRMTGQDVERGTFSHRQAVLHDAETGETYTPLQHLPEARGSFEIFNSPLSETAVLGFEYGFSTATRNALVLWEAQFGDFVNVAQPIIDQFIVSDRAKWKQDSSLVMLLPHGYEGQGPEHSSARLERFLQSAAENNMYVAYPSTPAQYYHILRRQASEKKRRPLILMQPKSLLRLPEASSRLGDLVDASFMPVIDDAAVQNPEDVKRLVFCTGKVYYDIVAK